MNRVKNYRLEKKISQSSLAKEIGVVRQTINLIEKSINGLVSSSS